MQVRLILPILLMKVRATNRALFLYYNKLSGIAPELGFQLSISYQPSSLRAQRCVLAVLAEMTNEFLFPLYICDDRLTRLVSPFAFGFSRASVHIAAAAPANSLKNAAYSASNQLQQQQYSRIHTRLSVVARRLHTQCSSTAPRGGRASRATAADTAVTTCTYVNFGTHCIIRA